LKTPVFKNVPKAEKNEKGSQITDIANTERNFQIVE